MTTPLPGWNDAYAASAPAPWDIGRPQPEFIRLANAGLNPVFEATSAQAWLATLRRL